ncbi:MAG: type I pullulanase [Muribaculaceae bacterium]|nr:type I pullulanase [Muribaculaceae bacterium]
MKHLIKLVAIIMALLVPMTINARTGVNYSPGASAFTIETNSDAQQVKLRIYKDGLGGKPVKTVNMKRVQAGGTLWQATVKGDLKGKFYTFDVQYGGKFRGECPGIWATAVGVNGKRGAIVDMAQTNPQDWSADKRPAIAAKDLIIYEMHHRDFSIDESGGFTYRGKFLALTEPRAIEHLKTLGVNAVHILPSFDYASVDETRLDEPQYNWGYDPVNYNVPEGGYSTDPYKPEVRIREFKQMVQALHQAGIKVILDVVYNHTWNIDGSNFQLTRPDYFYRKNTDGTYSNGSGCGNETASEREAMREFMIESVKYWVEEYHIDGFRFDLMGVHDITTMNAIRAALPSDIFIYGEGWSAGSCAIPGEQLAMKANIQQMPSIAAFSDEIRDALRGPWDSNSKAAFLGGVKGNEESIKFGIVGAIKHPGVDYSQVNYSKAPYATEPTQMISYVSCHDDMCLVDRLQASVKDITLDELIRLDLLAQTVVMTSQGVPFMLSGEEMLRNKKGVHNSYESPDSINHLDWDNLERYPQVMEYYQNLIALRKAHSAFHMGSADMVRRNLDFLPGANCLVVYHINGKKVPGETWGDIYVAFNAHKRARTIEIPDGTYTVVCRNIKCDKDGLTTVKTKSGKVTIPPQSALIIHN